MRSIKMLGLAAIAALMAMAFVGVGSAMAESTILCTADESPCKTPATHVHEVTEKDAQLLNSLGNVKCVVLFLGDTAPVHEEDAQAIEGKFTYSSCFRKKIFGGEEACTVTEINGPVEISLLKEGHETGKVTGKGEVEVKCGEVIQCTYNGEGLKGTAVGPLLSTAKNGEVKLSEQTTKAVKGAFCPETAKLDITTTALEANKAWIAAGSHYCVDYPKNNGFYEDSECSSSAGTQTKLYELVIGPGGLTGVLCVRKRTKIGLWDARDTATVNGVCLTDNAGNTGRYEKGEIK